MSLFNVLVVDDEPLARELLETYVSNIRSMHLIACCANAIEAFSILNESKIDLLLLDISMPEFSGIDLIKTLNNPPQIILTTAHSEYAVQSYELNILDYLLKPITFERFMKSVNKFAQTQQVTAGKNVPDTYQKPSFKMDEIIFVKSNGKIIKIDINNICFIEGLQNYIMIWTEHEKIIVHNTLKNFSEQLINFPIFVRVNKSYIINIKYISEVDGNTIRIKNERIPIGATYKSEIYKLFNKSEG